MKTDMDQQLAAKYPEHMKLEAIPQSDRDAIGQFIEWLDSRGYTIAKYREEGNNGEPRYIPATEADIAEIRRYKGYEGSAIERQALTKGVENPNYEYNPSGFYPVHTNPEKWLTDYYSIRPNSSGIIYRWRQDYPRYSCREWTFDTGITPGIHARKPAPGLPLAFMPGSLKLDYPWHSCQEARTGITPGIHARKPAPGLPLAFMPGSPHHRSFPHVRLQPIA